MTGFRVDLRSVTEEAAAQGVTRQAVQQQIDRGTLQAVKVGRTFVVVRVALEQD